MNVAPSVTEKYQEVHSRGGVSLCQYSTTTEHQRVSIFLTNTMLVYIVKGKKVLHLRGGDILLQPGDGFLAAKGHHLVSEILGEDEPFASLLFYFDDRVLGDFFEQYPLGPWPEAAAWPDPSSWAFTAEEHLQNLFLTMIPYFSNPQPQPNALVRNKIQELLWLLSQNPAGQRALAQLWSQGSLHPPLEKVLMENYDKPLRLLDLARLCGRSLTAFKRDVSQAYGMSPHQWILKKRLELARNLLHNPLMNVTQAALESGFQNLSHFSTAYRRHWGVSPLEEKRTFSQTK